MEGDMPLRRKTASELEQIIIACVKRGGLTRAGIYHVVDNRVTWTWEPSTIVAEDFDAARRDLDIVIPQLQEEFDLIPGPNGPPTS
jgi:hypothetical protein